MGICHGCGTVQSELIKTQIRINGKICKSVCLKCFTTHRLKSGIYGTYSVQTVLGSRANRRRRREALKARRRSEWKF